MSTKKNWQSYKNDTQQSDVSADIYSRLPTT